MRKTLLARCVARATAVTLGSAGLAAAQTLPAPMPDGSTALSLDRIVVQGQITYRDRPDAIAPTLVYDLEYFQRFEPNTVGDMLKRVPGVAFVGADIMEFDGAQLRGLTGGYTQVLINGKQVPGAGDDRSFWVDRIPAEMVDRVEILRSSSANRSGDAIAGAINIVLRDAYLFDGSYVRLGANRWDDGEINPTFGAVTSGDALGGRILAGINVQDRYRSKEKRSDRFADPSRDELVSFEDQVEVKDGRDYSGNLSYTAEVGETDFFSVDGFYVKTDRDVTEVSREVEFDGDDVIEANVPGLNPIDQRNWGIGAEYAFDMAGGRTKFVADHARFEDDSSVTEESHEYVNGEWDASEAEAEAVDAKDDETGFRIAHERPFGDAVEMEFGIDYRTKERAITYSYFAFEAENEGDPVVYEPDGVVASVIEEDRLDPYLMFSGNAGVLAWEAGVRYETTDSDIRYVEDGEIEGAASNDYDELLPSLHLKWDVSDSDRISLSLAKTVKGPNFNELIPAVLDGEFGDNDYVGNPQLGLETAHGLDLGFEHRLGRRGVVGVNVFYRDVKDLIEVVNTGEPSEDALDSYADDIEEYMEENGVSEDEAIAANPFDPDSFVFTSANVGDGTVYGVEFDLSTPLSAFGLENTGVFANYSYLKSEVTDFLGERRFNDQAKSVYNIGFIQDLPNVSASFGATYRKQGDAFSRILAEEVLIRYGEDLELFVEKRFGDSVSVRLTAANLLDASKDEFFDKFDNLGDQIARDYDEYEVESEEAGPSYQVVMRWAF
ncbi:TonB-dependent receptor plug domain-containing protein [Chiayiivirga flava]|uniref:Outer membrane receptor protein involved in Fe transport n=1 Tax=Chiayiivirga flava TaxID=659595 RepID=A0A7W8D975_9GAMM|nr:TonB-dependent receptor [Chiayiivirga flava]MBB5208458.1 outer membrane receptor protein involved in Fe transport [Chiayiivirga flava]